MATVESRDSRSGGRTGEARASRMWFEQPLNERIRKFLRLEFLFGQTARLIAIEDAWASRAAIVSLLETRDAMGRGDVKHELINELERQRSRLRGLEGNPHAQQGPLRQLLERVARLVESLHGQSGQPGELFSDQGMLEGVHNRLSIPGGTCDFDLPGFQHWLARPYRERRAALLEWLEALSLIRQAVEMILTLVRESGQSSREVAVDGVYQESPDASRPWQLIRVRLPGDSRYFPEISGGKHRISIRFCEQPVQGGRAVPTSSDVPFELFRCSY